MIEAADVYGDSAITMLPSFVATPERKVDEPPLNVKEIAPPVPNDESRVGLVPRTPGTPVVHVGDGLLGLLGLFDAGFMLKLTE